MKVMGETIPESTGKEPATAELPVPPFVTVEGVPNFRDVGGYECFPPDDQESNTRAYTDVQRRHMRLCYLFRSAQPTQITQNGVETLNFKLHVKHEFDLRSFKELRIVSSRYPHTSLDVPGVKRHHIPIYIDEDYSPISMAQKYQDSDNKEQPKDESMLSQDRLSKDGFIHAYEDILRQAGSSGSFRKVLLHVLEKPDEALVVHCTLGKDRTGIIIALILRLCGVRDEIIVWDYALTTRGLGKWREYLVKRLMDGAAGDYVNKSEDGTQETEKRPPTRAEAERIIGSHPEDMTAFLDMLDAVFGGARKYFEDFCGLTDAELNKIVANLTIEESSPLNRNRDDT